MVLQAKALFRTLWMQYPVGIQRVLQFDISHIGIKHNNSFVVFLPEVVYIQSHSRNQNESYD